MGHYIAGIVLPTGMVRNAKALLPGIKSVELPQESTILPISAEYLDAVGDTSRVVEPFQFLTQHIAEVLRDYSADCGIVYIETEYFGGVGTQCAAAWLNSQMIFGPAESETTWDHSARQHMVSNGTPINDALSAVGVEKEGELDEFDSLHLGNYRTFDGLYDS